MLVCVSPAKRLDWSEVDVAGTTAPDFPQDAAYLAELGAALSVSDLRGLMSISEDLARLTRERFVAFDADPQDVRPAAFAFAGDTFQGLEARSMDRDALDWAQRHLRILSGLYGMLRPLDLIRPYRLEMGSRLANREGATLYAFWGPRIAAALDEQAEMVGAGMLLNCASVEYFGAVDRAALRLPVVTPVFAEERNGAQKVISFHAKRARGAMARFVMERRIDRIEGVLDFDTGGYRYRPDLSEPDRPMFLRDEVSAAAA